jgi:photosystem II stability/assembly factor-like uncharacterized protein
MDRRIVAGIVALILLATIVLAMTVNVSLAVYAQSMPVKRAARHVMPAATAPPGIRPGLYAISFATHQIGCAGGVHRIVCTINAGRRWVQRYHGPATIVGLDLVSPQVGWAVGVHTLLRTTDGGRHWVRAGEPTQPLRSIDFVTPMQGWGIAGGTALPYYGTNQVPWPFARGTLVRTLDGGRTWVAKPAAGPVDSICFSSAAVGWAARGSTVRHTRDGGRTWRTVFTPRIYNGAHWLATVRCVGTAEARVLLSPGDDGTMSQEPYVLYRTLDGGHHWTAVLDEGYFSIDYPTARAPGGPGGHIGPLSIAGPRTVYILGLCLVCMQGQVQIMGTRDGGRTWSRPLAVPGLTFQGPYAIAFVDASHGWVAGPIGGHGAILATTDGGGTWTRQI